MKFGLRKIWKLMYSRTRIVIHTEINMLPLTNLYSRDLTVVKLNKTINREYEENIVE